MHRSGDRLRYGTDRKRHHKGLYGLRKSIALIRMPAITFPGPEWDRAPPADVGVSGEKLARAKDRFEARAAGDPYRIVVVKDGRIVAEWNHGVGTDERLGIASAAKSVYSTILGIAIDEGVVKSADAKLADLYPEALEVLPGEGPKGGRHARRTDRAITLGQLIANTSGYLKPDEAPGEVKHYQTFGMNVLTHALAKRYGLYDVADPEGSPGFEVLIDSRLAAPIRATWDYDVWNFDHHEDARLSVFGYYTDVRTTARDLARLGWLWCQFGRWENRQLVPESWLREATEPVPAEWEADPSRNMLETYGRGFWTNATGALWPSLPDTSFAASGAGSQHVWVWPDRDVVVVQSPGIYEDQSELDDGLLSDVVDAVE